MDSIISRKTDRSIVLDDIVGEKFEEDTGLVVNWLTEEEKGLRETFGVAANSPHLPSWLNLEATLPNLRFIQITNCACFEGLAPLCQLPNLDCVHINDGYSIVSVGEKFFWEGIQGRDTMATSCRAKPAFPKN